MIDYNLINPRVSAVIVIDVQNDFCSPKGVVARILKQDTSPFEHMISKLTIFLARAKKSVS